MEDLKYTDPITTSGIKQIPLNEYLFERSGMKPKMKGFNITDPMFDAKDFYPGGDFSTLRKDSSGNERIEVLPDGRVVITDVGI